MRKAKLLYNREDTKMKKNTLWIALFLLIGISFVLFAKVTVDYDKAASF